MAVLKIPKRVPVDVMRQILGDQRTEDFLTAAYGPKLLGPPVIKIRKGVFENMLAYLEGRSVPDIKGTYYQAIPAVFRLYYRESPQAKRQLVAWIRKKIEGAEPEADGAVSTGIAQAAAQMTQDTKKSRRRRKATTKARRREKVGV